MNPKVFIMIAGILGALAVGIGAFGAHGLEPVLKANKRLDTFETGVKYHFYHTLALLLLSLIMIQASSSILGIAAYCFILGIILFSGSLYVLSLTNILWLGAITPIGGLFFIVGWLLIVGGAFYLKI